MSPFLNQPAGRSWITNNHLVTTSQSSIANSTTQTLPLPMKIRALSKSLHQEDSRRPITPASTKGHLTLTFSLSVLEKLIMLRDLWNHELGVILQRLYHLGFVWAGSASTCGWANNATVVSEYRRALQKEQLSSGWVCEKISIGSCGNDEAVGF
jgi:hypothetical protein